MRRLCEWLWKWRTEHLWDILVPSVNPLHHRRLSEERFWSFLTSRIEAVWRLMVEQHLIRCCIMCIFSDSVSCRAFIVMFTLEVTLKYYMSLIIRWPPLFSCLVSEEKTFRGLWHRLPSPSYHLWLSSFLAVWQIFFLLDFCSEDAPRLYELVTQVSNEIPAG